MERIQNKKSKRKRIKCYKSSECDCFPHGLEGKVIPYTIQSTGLKENWRRSEARKAEKRAVTSKKILS